MRVLFENDPPEVLKVRIDEAINEALSEFLNFVTLVDTKVSKDGSILRIPQNYIEIRKQFNEQ